MVYSSVGRGLAGSLKTGVIKVPFVFIILFVIAVLNAGLTITAYQGTQSLYYDAAWVQMGLGMIGLGIGIIFAFLGFVKFNKPESESYEDMFSWDRGWIIWGAIGFAVAKILSFLYLTSTQLSIQSGENLNIVLSAAPFEEALFSLGFGTFFILLLPTLTWSIERIVRDRGWAYVFSIIMSSFIIAIMFGFYHIGVGYKETELVYTMITRFVYAIVYLKSRNVMAPTFAHLMLNSTVYFGL